MKIQARITIPYAVANYAEMRDRGFYYVDKTITSHVSRPIKRPYSCVPAVSGKACWYLP